MLAEIRARYSRQSLAFGADFPQLVRLPCALRRGACQSFSFQLNFSNKSNSRIAVGRRESKGRARPHIGRFLSDQDRLAGFRKDEKHFLAIPRPYRPEQLIDVPVSRSSVQPLSQRT
jgi:hypothetical protein